MALPLATPERGKGANLPTKDAIFKIFQVATTVEAARHSRDELKRIFSEARMLESGASVLHAATDIVEALEEQNNMLARPWSGDTNIPDTVEDIKFQTQLQNRANTATQQVAEKEINFNFAIGDGTRLVRGYSSDNYRLEGPDEAAMDTLFNAWLAENGMICVTDDIGDAIIYEYEPDEVTGKIAPRKNERGEEVRVEARELAARIASENEGGFVKFVSDRHIKVSTHQQRFPERSPEPAPERSGGMQAGGG